MTTTHNIVRVDPVLKTATAEAGDISTTMILDTNHRTLDVFNLYTAADQVASGTKIRTALDSAFLPAIPPELVVVGRSKGVTMLTPLAVEDAKVYGFSVQVSDLSFVDVTYTTGVGEDAQDILDALKTQIDANAEVAAIVNVAVVGTGTDAVMSIALADTALDYRVYDDTLNFTITYTTTEAAADSLSRIQAFYPEFTFVGSTDHSTSYQLSLSSACEVAKLVYVTSTDLPISYTAFYDGETLPDSTDVVAMVDHNNRIYSKAFYHDQAEAYPEFAYITQHTYLEPGTDAWQFENFGFGVAQHATLGRALNDSELIILESKNGATVLNLKGLVVLSGYNGTGDLVGSGDRIEHVVWGKYCKQELEARLATYLVRSNKVAFNPRDLGAIEALLNEWLESQVSDSVSTKALSSFKLNVPSAADISPEDKAAGLLQITAAVAFLDASISSIILSPFTLTI